MITLGIILLALVLLTVFDTAGSDLP